MWSPELLGPLIMTGEALPVRTAMCRMKDGLPDSPPGGGLLDEAAVGRMEGRDD